MIFSFILYYSIFCNVVNKSNQVLGDSSFEISFQESGDWSTNEWGKYMNEIPRLEEFTACHWQRMRFFASDIIPIWSYCMVLDNSTKKLECTQIYLQNNPGTANRRIILHGWIIGGGGTLNTTIDNFEHRTWGHICWIYSTAKGFAKVYYNGVLIATSNITKNTIIPGTNDVPNSLFIIGQEPDSLKGDFDITQVFNGEISELNIWKTVLPDDTISKLSNCIKIIKGDALSWQKENFEFSGGKLKDISDFQYICSPDPMLVIFPERQPMHIARKLCASHGGRIVSPRSMEENSKILDIVKKHSSSCLEDNVPNIANRGLAAWLGLSFQNFVWYAVNDDKIIDNITFNNWDDRPNETEDTNCAFMKSDGKWSFKSNDACFPSLILCTVCSFDTFPILTLNGLCSSLDIDWNYYISTDDTNKIKFYEGYKTYDIIEIGSTWTIKPKKEKQVNFNINRQSENIDSYPVGRSQWNTTTPICNINLEEQHSMTFSKCEFGKEFTCDSGRCIELSKRCDYVPDCYDESDEIGCKLILRPDTYRTVQPPEPMNRSEALPIQTQIEILTIDSIDTINMVVVMTINIRLYWKDSRLKFSNLIIGGKNIVQSGTVKGLWIPLDYFIFENSIIGEIEKDNSYEVRVDALDQPLPTETSHSVQNRLFSGEENALYMTERYKVSYRCPFFLRTFPFDEQKCPFMLQMKSDKITTISLTKFTPPYLYKPKSKVVGQFKITNIIIHSNIQILL